MDHIFTRSFFKDREDGIRRVGTIMCLCLRRGSLVSIVITVLLGVWQTAFGLAEIDSSLLRLILQIVPILLSVLIVVLAYPQLIRQSRRFRVKESMPLIVGVLRSPRTALVFYLVGAAGIVLVFILGQWWPRVSATWLIYASVAMLALGSGLRALDEYLRKRSRGGRYQVEGDPLNPFGGED